MKRLITIGDLHKLNRLLTNPKNLCRNCYEFGSDCMGVSRCYGDSYLVIEYTLRRADREEIEELIKS